ncbi:hypothetical protein EFL02_11955 [Enterococcus faecium]|nr:hypothetical protein [Enterococcus faecium]EGP5249764.1 hypothetical protein [Enterococcus faecium]EGP5391104.1 hypothetical protein [Enterococcus faecium]
MSLPFNSEAQGAISKNSFSCLLNIVTCDRGVGRRTPFTKASWKSRSTFIEKARKTENSSSCFFFFSLLAK